MAGPLTPAAVAAPDTATDPAAVAARASRLATTRLRFMGSHLSVRPSGRLRASEAKLRRALHDERLTRCLPTPDASPGPAPRPRAAPILTTCPRSWSSTTTRPCPR